MTLRKGVHSSLSRSRVWGVIRVLDFWAEDLGFGDVDTSTATNVIAEGLHGFHSCSACLSCSL